MKRRVFVTALLGGAATFSLWPLAARAQQKMPRVIGYLHFASPGYVPAASTFLEGIQQQGYVEGDNLTVEYRWAEGHYDRLAAMASDLVAHKVDLIAAFGPPLARAPRKNASTTISYSVRGWQ